MYRNHCVTSDVHFRKGALIPSFGEGFLSLLCSVQKLLGSVHLLGSAQKQRTQRA